MFGVQTETDQIIQQDVFFQRMIQDLGLDQSDVQMLHQNLSQSQQMNVRGIIKLVYGTDFNANQQ